MAPNVSNTFLNFLCPAREASIYEELRAWVNQAGKNEKPERNQASEKILKCYDDEEPFLDLSNLHLTSLPNALSSCDHLEGLDISGNQLTQVPSLKNFSKLEWLDLSCNELTHLPNLRGCSRLKQIYGYCTLSSILISLYFATASIDSLSSRLVNDSLLEIASRCN